MLNRDCHTCKRLQGLLLQKQYTIMYLSVFKLLLRLSLETLQSDLNALKKQLTSVGKSLGNASEDLEQQMRDFIEVWNCCLYIMCVCESGWMDMYQL